MCLRLSRSIISRAATPSLAGFVEQLIAHAVEGLPVIQAGQDIIIALVLDTHAFQCGGGHILGQTDLA